LVLDHRVPAANGGWIVVGWEAGEVGVGEVRAALACGWPLLMAGYLMED
jgi:hypothetical protein